MTNDDIILRFRPNFIDIQDVDLLKEPLRLSSLLVYGEIHGIRENADIIYTLIHRLGIKRVAIENSPNIAEFINAASADTYDFSLIDVDTFDTSILSLEVAKTIATLVREEQIRHVEYIDTYFDTIDPSNIDHPESPQLREQALAKNILALDTSMPTLCLLGQWHTQTHPIDIGNGDIHHSALYRIRQAKPDVAFVHNIYRAGSTYNDGRVLTLPTRHDVEHIFCVKQSSSIDFDLHVPEAHHSRQKMF